MSLRIGASGPPLSEAELAAFEQRVGVELPADYRAFLLTHNGGRPLQREFKLGRIKCWVQWFHHVGKSRQMFEADLETALAESHPEGVLPIAGLDASTASGGYSLGLCRRIRARQGSWPGDVYQGHHGETEPGRRRTPPCQSAPCC